MSASFRMAKTKRPPDDKVPSFPATAAYKQWVWNEIRRRRWTQQNFVDEIKKADRTLTGGALTATISTGWLTQFLGPEDAERRYSSNTELMPAMNKALGIAPPPVCSPDDELGQVVDRFRAKWDAMPDDIKRAILALLGDGGPAR